MFNIYIAIYGIFMLAVLIGGTYKIKEYGYNITAIMFAVGGLIIFILFGIKWFSKNALFSKTPVSWPPMTNTCPDYLIHYGRKVGNKIEDTCIDTIGVSKNGALKLFPKGAAPATDDYYFKLSTDSSDPVGKIKELCERAIKAGLTWEGITNGESCIILNEEGTPGTFNINNCPK